MRVRYKRDNKIVSFICKHYKVSSHAVMMVKNSIENKIIQWHINIILLLFFRSTNLLIWDTIKMADNGSYHKLITQLYLIRIEIYFFVSYIFCFFYRRGLFKAWPIKALSNFLEFQPFSIVYCLTISLIPIPISTSHLRKLVCFITRQEETRWKNILSIRVLVLWCTTSSRLPW